eukprot:scaffold62697_cov57-Phaeocystis_antarctica.AAC.6
MLRLAFRVMGDTRGADATPPLDGDPCAPNPKPSPNPTGDPCAVDLEPSRRHRQPRSSSSGSSSAGRNSTSASHSDSPRCWLGEISSEVSAALLSTCAQSGDLDRAMELYERAFEQHGRVLPQRPMSALLEGLIVGGERAEALRLWRAAAAL